MKIQNYIIFSFLLFSSCGKNPANNSTDNDIQTYTNLYNTVKKKNDLWQVSAKFHGDKCNELSFYFEDLYNGFPKDADKIVSNFEYLNKVEINCRMPDLPMINNSNIRELILSGGVEALNFNSGNQYLKNIDRLLISNHGFPVQVISIAPENKLRKLAIVDAQIENIDTLTENIEHIESLNLAKNKIQRVHRLPFKEGTIVDLRLNPLEDTISIKALNPGLIFIFN